MIDASCARRDQNATEFSLDRDDMRLMSRHQVGFVFPELNSRHFRLGYYQVRTVGHVLVDQRSVGFVLLQSTPFPVHDICLTPRLATALIALKDREPRNPERIAV